MEIFWICVIIFALLAEAATMGMLIAIWFVPGALAALLMALTDLPVWSQVVVFLALSGSFLLLAGTIFRKFFKKKQTKTNLDRILGETCLVTEEINNLAQTGTVKIGAVTWTARAADGTDIIPVGTVVSVQSIEGVKVLVTRESDAA